MNKLTLVATLGFAAVLILGIATCTESRADMIPNGDFETLYEAGTTIPTTYSDGGYTKVPVGLGMEAQGGSFSHAGDPALADLPGWVSDAADAPVFSADYANAHSGSYQIKINGDGWGQPGGHVVSAASLGLADGSLLDLSMWARVNNGAWTTDPDLDLLANGIALTPTGSVFPAMTSDWQKLTRSYDTSGVIGQDLTIQFGIPQNEAGKAIAGTGTQSCFDDVSLTVVPEPSSILLLVVGAAGLGLGLWRRKRAN